MKIIQERGRETGFHHYHVFSDPETNEQRYSIQVNQDGTLHHWEEGNYRHKPEDPLTMREWREQNFADIKAEAAQGLLRDVGIKQMSFTFAVPKIGLCDCGTQVELERFTNTCDGCGTDYDSSGNGLAPRSQWGEDTGESLGDILMIDSLSPEQLLETE